MLQDEKDESSSSDDNDSNNSENIDNEWINDYKQKEKEYEDFYKEDVEQIKLFYLYTSSSNVLEFIKKDFIMLNEGGILKKDIIISLIKNNQVYNKIKYKLLSLVRFNIDIDPDEICDFSDYSDIEHSSRFITSEKYLNDIKYSNTISIFQDLNCLYLIFYEEKTAPAQAQASAQAQAQAPASAQAQNNNTTKKIKFINNINNINNNINTNNKKYKKTRRLRLG